MPSSGLSLVIIADPDPLEQQRISTCLASNYQSIAAGSLQDAYTLTRRMQPQLLILNLDQPFADGLALVRHLREDPALLHLPIACTSQCNTIDAKVRAFQAGADHYWVKPVTMPAFRWSMVLLPRLRSMGQR